MVKILRKSQGSIPKLRVFIDQKSIFRHYCIQTVKDGIQILSMKYINNECVNHCCQFILEKVKKNLRKFLAQFRETLRK